MNGEAPRWPPRLLLVTLVAVPLVPNPGLFTNSDAPKWAVLVAGALLALVATLARAVRRKDEVRVILPEHLVLLLFVVLVGLRWAPRAPDANATLRALALVGTLAAFAIAAAQYLRDGDRTRRALAALVAAGGLTSLVGIVQAVLGEPQTGTFGNPTFASEFAAPALILALVVYRAGHRTLATASAAPMLANLAFMWLRGESRADLVALAAGLATFGALGLLRRAARRPPRQLLVAGLLAAILATPYVLDALPVLFGSGETVAVRRHLRASTFEMARDHPGLGVGVEGFRAAYPEYRHPEEVELSMRREVTFAHNLPLQVAAETGIPGLLILLVFLWVPLSSGLRSAYREGQDSHALGATAAMVAVLVSAQLSAPLRHPASALLFFTLSAPVVARRNRRVVTDLKARYRRALPVLLLLVPVVTAALVLPKHLVADGHLEAARARELELSGGMDEVVAGRLERSLAAEPSLDALRQLAFYRTGTGEPKRALALLETLLSMSPHDEQGRIEKARALRADGRAAEALPLLDELAEARPGDDVVLFLRAKARWDAEDDRGALRDFLAALRTAPVGSARRHVRWVAGLPDWFKDEVLRVTREIGAKDLDRGIAIFSSMGEAMRNEEDRSIVYYSEVLVLLEHGELDGAMNVLRRMPYERRRAKMLSDPRLEPLRGRADFRALLDGD